MGDLSRHFSTWEFRCRCCNEAKVESKLVNALQELRFLVGKPILINSGYRCPKHNKAIGGAKNSQHILGTAADIVIPGLDVEQMFSYAKLIEPFEKGGIGIYPDQKFIHVDVRRRQARWARVNGKYLSLEKYFSREV